MKLTRFGLLAAVILLTAACSDAGRYITVEGFAQGGTWHLICRLPQGVRPQQVKATADSLLLEIDRSVSGYNRGSLLSRLNAGEVLPLDRHFIANFEMSRKVWEMVPLETSGWYSGLSRRLTVTPVTPWKSA